MGSTTFVPAQKSSIAATSTATKKTSFGLTDPPTSDIIFFMRCRICNEDAIGICVYGLYEYKSKPQDDREAPVIIPRGNDPYHELALCKTHVSELWSKIHGAVGIGEMHFEIRKPI